MIKLYIDGEIHKKKEKRGKHRKMPNNTQTVNGRWRRVKQQTFYYYEL